MERKAGAAYGVPEAEYRRLIGRSPMRGRMAWRADDSNTRTRFPQRSTTVTLSSRLRNVDLTLECKLCGHLIARKGGWFMTASTFKCKECKGQLRLTYSDKVELFAKHAHLLA
jgi:hypothetical protein